MDRRLFLARVGKASVAVAFLGVGACSGDADGTTSAGGSTTSAAPPSPEEARGTQGSTSSDAPTEDSASPTTSAAPEALSWERVSLGFVSAYVLRRGSTGTVVDTGVSGSEDAIELGLAALDLAWPDIAHVVLTHHHPDHVGSVGPVVERASAATVHAGEADIATIASPRPLVAAGDGDEVMGLVVIETPGHTAGSITVLDEATGVLVAGDALSGGDAMGGESGTVAGPNPDFSSDMTAANASVRKLAGLTFETVLFGHGEPVLAEGSGQVARLAADL